MLTLGSFVSIVAMQLRTMIKRKFKGDDEANKAFSGFLILRFLCPLLVTPDTFDETFRTLAYSLFIGVVALTMQQ